MCGENSNDKSAEWYLCSKVTHYIEHSDGLTKRDGKIAIFLR